MTGSRGLFLMSNLTNSRLPERTRVFVLHNLTIRATTACLQQNQTQRRNCRPVN